MAAEQPGVTGYPDLMAITSVPRSWVRALRREFLKAFFYGWATMLHGGWALVFWTSVGWSDIWAVIVGTATGQLAVYLFGTKRIARKRLQMFSDLGIEVDSPEMFVKSPRSVAKRLQASAV